VTEFGGGGKVCGFGWVLTALAVKENKNSSNNHYEKGDVFMFKKLKSIIVVAVTVVSPFLMSGCLLEDNSECGYMSGNYIGEYYYSSSCESACYYRDYSSSEFCSKDGKCFCGY
jgi:hypothetical protein